MKRLSFILLIVVLFAMVTSTRAQVIFSASAGNPQVRVGGMTETVGDAALTSTNGTVAGILFPAGSGTATITLTYSSTITNKTLTSATATCSMAVANTPVACAPLVMGPSVGGAAGILVTVSNITINDATAASTKLNASWTAAGNTLTIQFAPTAGTVAIYFNSSGGTVGGGLAASIAIHGVRINAAGLGIPPTLHTVSAFVNTHPSANIQLAAGSTSLTLGTLASALGSVARLSGSSNASDAFYSLGRILVTNTFAAPATSGTTCGATACNAALTINPKSSWTNSGFRAIPQSAAAGGTVIITGDEPTIDRGGADDFGGNGGTNAIGIKIVEGYPGTLTSAAQEGGKSNSAEVSNGSRIRIDFSGLPSQVVVGAPIRVMSSNATAAMAVSGLTMDLVGNTQCSIGYCGTPQTALADVRAPSGGALTIEYEVTGNTGGITAVPSDFVRSPILPV